MKTEDDDYIMPWGKHKGERLSSLKRRTIDWYLEQDWIIKWPELQIAMEEELEMRDRTGERY